MQEYQLYPVLDYNWGLLAPEWTILITATLLSLWDLFLRGPQDRRPMGWVAVLGTLVAILFVLLNVGQPVQEVLGGKYRLDAFANAFKLIILGSTLFALLAAIAYTQGKEVSYRGEFYYLLLTAALGACIVVSSTDLITIYIGFEVLSVSSYIMAGMRRKNLKSNESAFKYVIYGGASSATMLYGISFLYGLTGTTNLEVMRQALPQVYEQGFGFILVLAFLLTLVGIGFKISTAPFHMWAPDVYEGSPTPLAAFLSVASKVAGYTLLFRLFLTAFFEVGDLFGPPFILTVTWAVGIVAALSMIWGNTGALKQTNAKRLLAYSSIGQVGYLLIPFATLNNLMYEEVLYFLLAYLLMNMGAFAVVQVVCREKEDLSAFAGLYRRSPWLALGMTVLVVSLAGFPITAGFVGKFLILMGALGVGNLWLPLVMVATTVVSYYVYFGFLRQIYMRPAEDTERIRLPLSVGLTLVLTVAGTLLFGLFPHPVLETLHTYFPVMEHFFAPAEPGLR